MINIQIDDLFMQEGLEEAITEAVSAAITLHYENLDEIDLSVVVTGDNEIRYLNNEFLGTDAATDVLSFPGGDVDPDSGHTNLGDIILSFPTALSQASNRQGTVLSEIQLLVVHGVLHLMGYDHAEESEKKQMWSLQAKALQALKLDSINPS